MRRRLWFGFSLGLSLVASALLGAAFARADDGVITARQVVIVDGSGAQRMKLSTDDSGEPSIALLDANGVPLASVALKQHEWSREVGTTAESGEVTVASADSSEKVVVTGRNLSPGYAQVQYWLGRTIRDTWPPRNLILPSGTVERR
jgi:hypothetical protein